MHDLLGSSVQLHNHIFNCARHACERTGYSEVSCYRDPRHAPHPLTHAQFQLDKDTDTGKGIRLCPFTRHKHRCRLEGTVFLCRQEWRVCCITTRGHRRQVIYALESARQHIKNMTTSSTGVARALLSNSLHLSLPQRLFYYGPMFRRERPQKGRYRQVCY